MTMPPITSLRGRGGRAAVVARAAAALGSMDGAAIANLRVEVGVQDVGYEVGRAVDDRDDEDAGLNEGKIMALDGKEKQSPEPGVGEDGLDDDDATNQKANVDGQHGYGRQ